MVLNKEPKFDILTDFFGTTYIFYQIKNCGNTARPRIVSIIFRLVFGKGRSAFRSMMLSGWYKGAFIIYVDNFFGFPTLPSSVDSLFIEAV